MHKELGTFTVTGGDIRVTDPCYTPTTWCSGHFPALNGKWYAHIELADTHGRGQRVWRLIIRHETLERIRGTIWANFTEKLDVDVGVDSGQCGFWDSAWYEKNQGVTVLPANTFYGQVCNLTSDPRYGGVTEFGAVSSSGFGDGGYECFVHRDPKGNIDGAEVVFIGEEEEETDDED